MPSGIDSRLTTALEQFTSASDATPGVVDSAEARELIETAKSIDKENASFFGLVSDGKARKQLGELLGSEPSKFEGTAAAMVDTYAETGRELDSRLVDSFARFTSESDSTPGVVDAAEAMKLIGFARTINRENRLVGALLGPVGTESVERLVRHTGESFDTEATRLVSNFVGGQTAAREVSSWKSEKPTWHCHWFPMKESKPNGGDPINNLYAPGGILEKYDQVFGRDSRDYELNNNFRAYDSDSSDADWAGHCNNASEVACILEQPKHSVTYKGVTFSPKEIEGLLVKVSASLRADRVDFEGRRYNGMFDDAKDPKPHVFLERVLEGWGSEADNPIPFVLDIDRKEQVWNYPYDQGKVWELSQAPSDFDSSDLPSGGRVSFYAAELKGTGFEEQARLYQFWIQYDDSGDVLKSGWIEGRDAKVNPDFAWRPRPVGDLSEKSNWVTNTRRQSNPEVKAEEVFEIYARSLNENYDSVWNRAGRWFDGLMG